jgi:hypothetical protein
VRDSIVRGHCVGAHRKHALAKDDQYRLSLDRIGRLRPRASILAVTSEVITALFTFAFLRISVHHARRLYKVGYDITLMDASGLRLLRPIKARATVRAEVCLGRPLSVVSLPRRDQPPSRLPGRWLISFKQLRFDATCGHHRLRATSRHLLAGGMAASCLGNHIVELRCVFCDQRARICDQEFWQQRIRNLWPKHVTSSS